MSPSPSATPPIGAPRFCGKVAVVTGGASGIGRATAARLGREGARVVIADTDAEAARRAAEVARAAGAPEAIHTDCDVSREADAVRTVAFALERFGRLDVIVNNAGKMIFKPLEEHSEADFLDVLRVDLLGAFFFTKQAFLHMSRPGTVVNVSSVHAVETTPLVSAYAAAKAALLSLTRSASMEGRPRGIRVNAVLPGAIETPMLRDNPNIASGRERLDASIVGTPEQVAAAIAFLASEDSSFIEGTSLRVDGGRLNLL